MNDRQAWLAARRKGIGGSDVAALLGLSPWAGPFEVWLDKTGQAPLDSGETTAQRRGRLMEEPVARMYAEITGYTVAPPSETIGGAHREGSAQWMLGSPDRIVYPAEVGLPFGLECKTSRYPDDAWGPDRSEVTGKDAQHVMPVTYALQCLWYMEVTGLARWDLAVLFMATDDLRIYTIHRDPNFGAALVAKCGEWWQHHVAEGNAPSLDGSHGAAAWILAQNPHPRAPLRQAKCGEWWQHHVAEGNAPSLDGSHGAAAWILAQNPHPRAPLRQAQPHEEALLAEYQEALTAEKAAIERRETLEVHVKAAVGENEGIDSAVGRVTWLYQKGRESLDTKTLRAECPEIAAKYTKTGDPIRVLRKKWRQE